jgi:RNA polymerase sigma factor (sigma-70 family)
MTTASEGAEPSPKPAGVFATTHWSVVLAAGRGEDADAAEALEQLCRAYWYPLYVFVRRRGYQPEDAQDLTQEFFARFLRKEYFRLADSARGRFRTFLVHALEHFLVNEWKRARRLRRGGGQAPLSLEFTGGEERYARKAAASMTPSEAYERDWAITLLDQVLDSLQCEYTDAHQGRTFQELAGLLWGKERFISFAEVGARLGMTEGAARVALHRLRRRYRERLQAVVAQTVANPTEVEEELRHLIAVVSRPR